MTPDETQAAIRAECASLAEMLCSKNQKYGNSALDPVRIFSRSGAIEQLRVRIDDKLNRIRNMPAGADDEDTIQDLLGYLVLYRIATGPTDSPKTTHG